MVLVTDHSRKRIHDSNRSAAAVLVKAVGVRNLSLGHDSMKFH